MVSPVQSHEEQGDTRDGQKCADEIDAPEHFALAEAERVDSWRRLVPDGNDDEANQSETSNNNWNITPAVLGDQLAIQRGGSEWHESHNDVSDSQTALGDRNQLRNSCNRCEKLNADTHS